MKSGIPYAITPRAIPGAVFPTCGGSRTGAPEIQRLVGRLEHVCSIFAGGRVAPHTLLRMQNAKSGGAPLDVIDYE